MENNIKLRKIIENTVKEFLRENFQNNQILYHGTNNKFVTFNNNNPVFFVDDINIAKTYGDYIIKAKLNLNNPIYLDFEGNSTYYFIDKWYLPSDLANKLKEIADDIKDHYMLDDDVKEELEILGFNDFYGDMDGIIMKNINDTSEGVFSSHGTATNYVVFEKNKIKIIK